MKNYDAYIIIGDMNLEPNKSPMSDFISNYSLHNLITKPTCFKSEKRTCIDLILTNKKSCLQHSNTFGTGMSDFHTLIHTSFKSSFYKLPAKKNI